MVDYLPRSSPDYDHPLRNGRETALSCPFDRPCPPFRYRPPHRRGAGGNAGRVLTLHGGDSAGPQRPLRTPGHLATTRPNGTVQVDPMWSDWDGERCCGSPTPRNGRSAATSQHIHRSLGNLAEIATVTTPTSTWGCGAAARSPRPGRDRGASDGGQQAVVVCQAGHHDRRIQREPLDR
jgi:hypothetical protein